MNNSERQQHACQPTTTTGAFVPSESDVDRAKPLAARERTCPRSGLLRDFRADVLFRAVSGADDDGGGLPTLLVSGHQRAMNTAHDFSLTSITGAEKALADYAGKVLLVVNVASRCGYTPQYRGLEELHRRLKDKGFVVVGVPCNQFGAQEPGSDAEIHAFCTSKYEVSFDMFSKVDVNGDGAAPLYRWLTAEGGPVTWNFAKFIVGRDGKLVGRFDSGTAPDSKELAAALDNALA